MPTMPTERGAHMETCGYNERKREVLSALEASFEGTSLSVAVMVGCSHEAASMALMRYHRMGLLTRYQLDGTRARAYALTDKGGKRLQWLQAQLKEAEEDEREEIEDEEEEDDLEEEEDDEEREGEPYSSITSLRARYRRRRPGSLSMD